MQLFYNSEINQNSKFFFFDKEESKHIIRVLRKKEQDVLFVTNGLGFLFETKISLASDKKCEVEIVSISQATKPKFHLHLAVAPTKMNERYEWFLEKSTEIGVQEITPIICEHSERKVINKERFEKIVLAGVKQSNRYFLPKINDAISLEKFFKKKYTDSLKFIAHCEKGDKKNLKSVLVPNNNTIILIGPEGDFSKSEINLAIDNNYTAISLGNTRLRTETAAIVACHSVVFFNEDGGL